MAPLKRDAPGSVDPPPGEYHSLPHFTEPPWEALDAVADRATFDAAPPEKRWEYTRQSLGWERQQRRVIANRFRTWVIRVVVGFTVTGAALTLGFALGYQKNHDLATKQHHDEVVTAQRFHEEDVARAAHDAYVNARARYDQCVSINLRIGNLGKAITKANQPVATPPPGTDPATVERIATSNAQRAAVRAFVRDNLTAAVDCGTVPTPPAAR